MKIALQLILIGVVIMLFSRCSTAKELLDKAERKDPEIVAKYARDKYPCTDLLKPDTLIVAGDTVILVECPEQVNDYISRGTDTIRIPGVSRTVRVPVTLPVQTRYITRWYEDSAKIKLGAFALSKLQVANDKLTADLAAMKSSRNWFRKWFWILIFIAGGLTVWTIRKIFI